MPRPELPLDASAGPVASFAAELRALRAGAGTPGYRVLSERAGYSAATLANAAAGRRMPSLAVVLAFVRACDGDPLDWEQRWRRVAAEATAAQRSGGTDTDPPYRGLTGYGVEDAALFFGRRDLVSQLVAMLDRQPFVAVFGVSGSGKSSLLRAGLVPALEAADRKPVELMTPGSRPLATLRGIDRPDSGIVLVVDQFEEVFTQCPDAAEREAFVAELAAIAESNRVVLGVRADFFARCAELPVLASMLAGATVPICPMDSDALRETITGPAHVVGLTVERALVTKILADAAGQPGALPLVSHALLETWRLRRSAVLTVAEYEASGGVTGAIAQTAEAVYARFDDGQQETARQVLVRLVALGEGVADTRRRVDRTELDFPDVELVLERLATARLVLLGEGTVEIAHEALIAAWPRLHGWLHTDRETLRLHREVTQASQVWHAHDRDPGALYRGARLMAWADLPLEELNDRERAFLTASRAREALELSARRRRVRLALVSLSAAVVAMAVLATFALVQTGRARDERDVARSRQLVASARGQLALDPEVGLLLARRAYGVRQSAETEAALRQATVESRIRGSLAAGQGPSYGVTYRPDGRALATTGDDGTVRVWGLSGPGRVEGAPVTLRGHSGQVWSPVYSRDGRLLASSGEDGTLRVWDVAKGSAVKVMRGHDTKVWNIAFSPDGRRLASAGDDGTARIWDVATGRATTILRGHASRVLGVVFGPDGQTLATTDGDGVVRIWNLRTGQTQRQLRGHENSIEDVAFSPDGRLLATASTDGTVRVWSVSTGTAEQVLRGLEGTAETVAFSPDGRLVAGAGEDGTILVWSATGDDHPVVLRGHDGPVWHLEFSPDGTRVASASGDGTIRFWDPACSGNPEMVRGHDGPVWALATSRAWDRYASGGTDGTVRVWTPHTKNDPVVLRGHQGDVLEVALSADGRRVASAGVDGTARIWDTAGGSKPVILRGHDGAVQDVAISPDGMRVATAGSDGTLRLWDADGGAAPRVLRGHAGAVMRVAISPDGTRLASAGHDGTVRIWSVSGAGDPVILRGHRGGLVWSVRFSPDGKRVVSGGGDGTVRIWDVAKARSIAVLRGHLGPVWSVLFNRTGRWLVSAGGDGTVRIWSGSGGSEPVIVRGHRASVERALLSDDGQRLATAHGDGTVRLWQCEVCGPMGEVLKRADTHATRELTAEERAEFLAER